MARTLPPSISFASITYWLLPDCAGSSTTLSVGTATVVSKTFEGLESGYVVIFAVRAAAGGLLQFQSTFSCTLSPGRYSG